jgi:multiple sugar transport system substrate-binding protein
LEEAKALFNIGDIQLVTAGWDEVGELALNRYLSGDSKYDLWRLPHIAYFSLATRGAFYPVNEILPPEYFETLSPITREKNERLLFEGNMFHFSVGTPDDYGHAPFAVVNLDMFEREGLPDPYELYENGEWNWKMVEEIGRQVTRDTDGDGVVDQWALAFIDPMFMIFSNGGAITRLGDDGKVYYALDEPQAINALRKLGEWENVLGISYGDWQMREFITGRTAIGIMPMWQIDANEYEFRPGILPLPMGDDVDDYVFSPGVADAIFLPRNSAYPLGMIALDNFLFPLEDYFETMEDYIRARAFDRTSYEVLNRGVSEVDGDAAYYHNFLGAWYQGETPFGGVIMGIKGGGVASTIVNEFKPQGQAMIDEYLKQ